MKKRASNKPKRRKYADPHEYERDLKRWKGLQKERYKDANPSQLSNHLLSVILSENDILQAGCRDLQEWRLRRFRRGYPVKKSGDNRPNLTVPARLSITDDDRFVLSLPRVLWTHVILPMLPVWELFQLLQTSRVMYVLANAELFSRARDTFSHERATPLAFELLRVVRATPHVYKRANLLKLSDRYVYRKHSILLVQAAIERHGYVEHVRDYADALEQKREAEADEELFMLESMPSRVADCNAHLVEAGYGTFADCAVKPKLLSRIGDWQYYLELRAYVHMERTRTVPKIVKSFKHPIVHAVLADCNLDDCVNRPGLSYLLNLISAKTFFGRPLSDYQISQYAQSIVQTVRYQKRAPALSLCCVWEDTSLRVEPMTEATQLFYPKTNMPCSRHNVQFWWLNHTTYHSYHFIGP